MTLFHHSHDWKQIRDVFTKADGEIKGVYLFCTECHEVCVVVLNKNVPQWSYPEKEGDKK